MITLSILSGIIKCFLDHLLCHNRVVKCGSGVDAKVIEVQGDLHHRLVAPGIGQVPDHLPGLGHRVPGQDVRELGVVLLVAADHVEDTVHICTSCLEPKVLLEGAWSIKEISFVSDQAAIGDEEDEDSP